MAFDIQPCSLSDMPDLVTVFQSAFANDPIVGRLMSDVPADIKHARDVQSFSKSFNERHLTGAQYFKAVELATGKTVGFAKWQVPCKLTPEQKVEKERCDSIKIPYPDGANVELCEDFWGQLEMKRRQWHDPELDYFLHLLAVSPTHQHHGLGSRLIEIGLSMADAAGARTYIEASAVGLPIYLRRDWKAVDEIRIDVRKYGAEEVAVEKLLMREPRVRR